MWKVVDAQQRNEIGDHDNTLTNTDQLNAEQQLNPSSSDTFENGSLHISLFVAAECSPACVSQQYQLAPPTSAPSASRAASPRAACQRQCQWDYPAYGLTAECFAQSDAECILYAIGFRTE
eukprot:6477970-Amphidinium_carterae.3